MVHSKDRVVSLTELAESVRRHLTTGLFVAMVIMALAVLAWLFLPREYGSEGRMVVRMGRANLGINTAPDGARSVSIQDTRETEIRSVMDLTSSAHVLGKVVDAVGAKRIMSNAIRFPLELSLGTGRNRGEMSAEEYKSLLLREKAIARLQRKLKVNHEKKSPNISVYCLAADPLMAQEIVDEIMRIAQKTHVEIHSAETSASHFDKGLNEKEAELFARQKALEEFSSKNNFLSVDEARGMLNGVIAKLENAKVDATLDLKTSEAMEAELREQAASLAEEFDLSTVGIERSATSGALELYLQRVAEKARMESKFKPSHPEITQITKEIEQLRKEVEALPEERVRKNKIRNPVYEEIKVALIKEMASVKAKRERLQEIENNLEEKNNRLVKFNELKTRAMELERGIELAQLEFNNYAKKRSESRMIDELDKEAISDIVIQQPGSLVLKKVSPKGSMILPLGFLVSMFSGLAVCVFADRKKLTNLTATEEIEDEIGVPVLATLPRLHSSRVLIN